MKTEPIPSPAIVQAVSDYQKQRAVLVDVLAGAHPSWAGHHERVKTASDAIEVIDNKIERLCLRLA